MAARRVVVTFVSQRNSLRSNLAEACLAHLDTTRFTVHSCGQPTFISEAIHPAAASALLSANVPILIVEPQGWDGLARARGYTADLIISLDEATQSAEPRWPGQPYSALWALPDVVALGDPGDTTRGAIQMLYSLRRRLELLTILLRRRSNPAAIRSDIRDLAHLQ